MVFNALRRWKFVGVSKICVYYSFPFIFLVIHNFFSVIIFGLILFKYVLFYFIFCFLEGERLNFKILKNLKLHFSTLIIKENLEIQISMSWSVLHKEATLLVKFHFIAVIVFLLLFCFLSGQNLKDLVNVSLILFFKVMLHN